VINEMEMEIGNWGMNKILKWRRWRRWGVNLESIQSQRLVGSRVDGRDKRIKRGRWRSSGRVVESHIVDRSFIPEANKEE
jgi:hypothetical protein